MENRINLLSYQNVEFIQSQLPDREFRKYCELKLLSTEDDISFIRKMIYRGIPMEVCEIGCGNGKLLLSMEREGMVSHATGYEVSESRCMCANRFLQMYESERIQIINKNFLDDCVPDGKYDLVILVDIVWLFISSLYDKAENDAIQWIRKSLRKDGVILMELEDYSVQTENIRKNGPYRFWEEFPEDDPFQYGLYRLDLDGDGNIVDDKLFVRRDNGKKDRFTTGFDSLQ